MHFVLREVDNWWEEQLLTLEFLPQFPLPFLSVRFASY